MANYTITELSNGYWNSNEDRYYSAEEMTNPYPSFLESDGIFSGSAFVPYGANTDKSYLTQDWEVSFTSHGININGGSAYLSGRWIKQGTLSITEDLPTSGNYYLIIRMNTASSDRETTLVLREQNAQEEILPTVSELTLALLNFSTKSLTDYRATEKCPILCGAFQKLGETALETQLQGYFDDSWVKTFLAEEEYRDLLDDIKARLESCKDAVLLGLTTLDENGEGIIKLDETGTVVDNAANFTSGNDIVPIEEETILEIFQEIYGEGE